jgi:triosephosphate isomerase
MEFLESIHEAISKGNIKEYTRNFDPIIAGNWAPLKSKENLSNLFSKLSADDFFKSHPLYLIVPFSSVHELSKEGDLSGIVAGSDVTFNLAEGSFLEQIGVKMLQVSLCRFVLIDVTEARSDLEFSLDQINTLIRRILEGKGVVFLYLGESQSQFMEGQVLEVLKQQLNQTLKDVPEKYYSNLILIYSPKWIIAQGLSKLSKNIQNSYHIFRHVLEEVVGAENAAKMRICLSIPNLNGDCSEYFKQSQFEGFYFPHLALQMDNFLETLKSIKRDFHSLEKRPLVKDLATFQKFADHEELIADSGAVSASESSVEADAAPVEVQTENAGIPQKKLSEEIKPEELSEEVT